MNCNLPLQNPTTTPALILCKSKHPPDYQHNQSETVIGATQHQLCLTFSQSCSFKSSYYNKYHLHFHVKSKTISPCCSSPCFSVILLSTPLSNQQYPSKIPPEPPTTQFITPHLHFSAIDSSFSQNLLSSIICSNQITHFKQTLVI